MDDEERKKKSKRRRGGGVGWVLLIAFAIALLAVCWVLNNAFQDARKNDCFPEGYCWTEFVCRMGADGYLHWTYSPDDCIGPVEMTVYKGLCSQRTSTCPTDYTPVCSNLGVTFSNLCIACRDTRVTGWQLGKCPVRGYSILSGLINETTGDVIS